jgi:metallo-beta-lactamase class B
VISARTYAGPLLVTAAYVVWYYVMIANQLRVRLRLRRAYRARGESFDRYFGGDREMLAADRYVGNMLEHMPGFLLLLWLNAIFVDARSATVAGAVYLGARVLYPFLLGRQLGRGVPSRILFATVVGYVVITYFVVRLVLASLGVSPARAAGPAALKPDRAKDCEWCAGWNAPQEPFRVFANTYYVGTAGLSAVLITSDKDLILLDGALPQSAPLIDQNIRKLGFRTEDVRLIVNSHAHYDHAGGIAALQRASGAIVAASAPGARAIESGGPTADDPQYAFGKEANAFPPVKRVKVVADGEILRAGKLAITAHLTPGHTPGSTTWTWRSCEGARCLDVVYADSLNPVSAPGFRFSGDATHPDVAATLRRSISKVGSLPCDVLLAVHPNFAGMEDKLRRRREQPTSEPFVDSTACRTYASEFVKRLDERIVEEGKLRSR